MSARQRATGRQRLGAFLAANPFPHPYTLGFFYREKMRAIHHIAPDADLSLVLEIGGGQGGLTKLLYPAATVFNLDMDPRFGTSPSNRRDGVRFLCGDATQLPFADGAFDAITMFDVIEHVPNDRLAMLEAWRVLRPGGALLLSTPHIAWRYPHHTALARWTPHEDELFREWGHVRRGYTLELLDALVRQPADHWCTFMPPGTALAHDLAWARLPEVARRLLITLIAPYTWAAYLRHRPHARGAEIAVCWRKPLDERRGG